MRSWPFHPLMRDGGRPLGAATGTPAVRPLAHGFLERAHKPLRKVAYTLKRILTVVRKADEFQLTGPRVVTRVIVPDQTFLIAVRHGSNHDGRSIGNVRQVIGNHRNVSG